MRPEDLLERYQWCDTDTYEVILERILQVQAHPAPGMEELLQAMHRLVLDPPAPLLAAEYMVDGVKYGYGAHPQYPSIQSGYEIIEVLRASILTELRDLLQTHPIRLDQVLFTDPLKLYTHLVQAIQKGGDISTACIAAVIARCKPDGALRKVRPSLFSHLLAYETHYYH